MKFYPALFTDDFLSVTPLAGVWIEIALCHKLQTRVLVTPLAGVWIEINNIREYQFELSVTPLAGVWIEIMMKDRREVSGFSHSPCGSVD